MLPWPKPRSTWPLSLSLTSPELIQNSGYDRDKIRKVLAQQRIPPRRCRKKPVHYSKRLDRKHHTIETLFSRQKDWRPIATRYDGRRLPFCHPPDHYWPLLVMRPDPRACG